MSTGRKENITEYLARQRYLKRFVQKDNHLDNASRLERRLLKKKRKKQVLIGVLVILFVFVLPKFIFVSDWERVEGTVTYIGEAQKLNFRQWSSRRHSYPVIKYFVDGQEYYHRKNNEYLEKKFEVGDKVPLLVDEANPAESHVYSFWGYWLPIPNLLIAGLLSFIWAGIVNIRTMK